MRARRCFFYRQNSCLFGFTQSALGHLGYIALPPSSPPPPFRTSTVEVKTRSLSGGVSEGRRPDHQCESDDWPFRPSHGGQYIRAVAIAKSAAEPRARPCHYRHASPRVWCGSVSPPARTSNERSPFGYLAASSSLLMNWISREQAVPEIWNLAILRDRELFFRGLH